LNSTAVGLLVVTLASPVIVHAAPSRAAFEGAPVVRRLAPDSTRLPRLLAQIKRAGQPEPSAGVSTQAVVESHSSRSIVFPAAGSVHGAGGEFFRSDVTLENLGGTQIDVGVVFLGRNATGEPPMFVIEDMRSDALPKTFVDFVGDYLGLEGQLGALWIIPLDDNGDPDTEGALDGFSRIWTNQPGRTGTVSQQFDAVDPFGFDFYANTAVMGLQQNAQYRTNWGIVNLDDTVHRFRVFATSESHPGATDTTVEVGPFSMKQESVGVGSDFGGEGMTVFIDYLDDFDVDPTPWVSFASSTDNTTGDGWVVLGSAQWDASDL